ncbi:hypothetical protein ACFE04_031297 [Oxalis oulophora]
MEETDEEIEEMIDRTATLPIELLREIFYFLPFTDQFLASLVSKTWKSAYEQLLHVDFDVNVFCRGALCPHIDFIDGVDSCLTRIHNQRVNLQTFRLNMFYERSRTEKYSRNIDRWIRLLPTDSLKSLELLFKSYFNERYKLPDRILELNSLNSLFLERCDFDVIKALLDRIQFINLKVLSLTDVNIDEQTLSEIISRCPKITTLELVYCDGIDDLMISSPNNHLLSVKVDGDFSTVEINSSTLQSCCYYDHNLHNAPHLMCINLIDLTLESMEVTLDENELESLILKLPLLNTLVLDFFYGMPKISVSSPCLKSLMICQVFDMRKVRIHAPSLEALEVSLSLHDTDHLKSSISIYAPKLQEVVLTVFCESKLVNGDTLICSDWFHQLREFLKQFAQKIILNLEFDSLKVTWDPDVIPSFYTQPPVAIERVNICISSKMLGNYGNLLDGLFLSCHPNTLSLWSPESNSEEFFEHTCQLIKTLENPIMIDCYSSSPIKCWRRCLKSFHISQTNDGHIIDDKDFVRTPTPEVEFLDLEIDFHFIWKAGPRKLKTIFKDIFSYWRKMSFGFKEGALIKWPMI